MKEFVGYCASCNTEVYCRDGFLDGAIADDKTLYCFECWENE